MCRSVQLHCRCSRAQPEARGISQTMSYVRPGPGIYLAYDQMTWKTYARDISDIYQTYDQMPVTLKTYARHIPDIYQTYDMMVCHIPGIYRNMYETRMSHKWSYSRYIPRISNFYRFQMMSRSYRDRDVYILYIARTTSYVRCSTRHSVVCCTYDVVLVRRA